MPEETLFEMGEPQAAKPTPPTRPEDARLLRPVRDQVEWTPRTLDSTISPRPSGACHLGDAGAPGSLGLLRLDQGGLGIRATRPPTPRCSWRCGSTPRPRGLAAHASWRGCARSTTPTVGCGVGYRSTTICCPTFGWRTRRRLDGLLTEMLASMMVEGLVTLRHVAQDGMRTRASAGAGSFRRQETLERCLAEAREQVAATGRGAGASRSWGEPAGAGGRERAARERQARVEEALRRLPGDQGGQGAARQDAGQGEAGQGDRAAGLDHGPRGSGDEDA